jgi:uncharacterized protein (TIGR02266 family)
MDERAPETPTTESEPEKRRDLRVPIRVLRVEGTEKGKHEIFFGYASNLSSSGMFIQTPSPKEIGTQVRLSFLLPTSKEKVVAAAEVVWIRNYSGKGSSPGMGLKFVEISAELARSIQKFVSEV